MLPFGLLCFFKRENLHIAAVLLVACGKPIVHLVRSDLSVGRRDRRCVWFVLSIEILAGFQSKNTFARTLSLSLVRLRLSLSLSMVVACFPFLVCCTIKKTFDPGNKASNLAEVLTSEAHHVHPHLSRFDQHFHQQ